MDKSREVGAQRRLDPESDIIPIEGHLNGIITLPNETRVNCLTVVTRLDHGMDWVLFAIPMGGLGYGYEVGGYPFGENSPTEWIDPVNEVLKDISFSAVQDTEFVFGVVGMESQTQWINFVEMKISDVPKKHWDGIVLRENGELVWIPPNQ